MRKPPDLLAWALSNDRYSKEGADFSTTEILKPPQITYLAELHEAKDMPLYKSFMSLIGTGVHAALEGAAPEDAIVEQRFYWVFEIEGQQVILGGKPDFVHDGLLNDYKCVLVAGRPKGDMPKEEHYWQGQFNSWLAIKNGFNVDTACTEYVFRDWNYGQAQREEGYPQLPNQPMPVPLLPLDEIEARIVERLTLHVRARMGHNHPCSDEDRWKTPDQWAVKKPVNKRARRVFSDKAEALVNLKPGEITEFRPGRAIRCAGWCEYSHVCPQFNGKS